MALFAKLKDGIIINVIDAPDDWSEDGYYPLPKDLWVGDRYIPTVEIPLEMKVKAQQDRIDFLEDCLAEMAMIVYQ